MKSLFLLSALAVVSSANAHFLWASLDPATSSVKVSFQEIPTDAPLPLAARSAQVKAWASSAERLALKEEGNVLQAGASDRAAASLDYGVLDRTAEGRGKFWLKYYAKAAMTPEASERSLGLPVELSAKRQESGWVVTVLQDGKPAAGAKIVATVPGSKEPFEGQTTADGTVTLPAFEGPLAVRALVEEKKAGTEAGKPYELIRSYSTLTVRPKNFSRIMRDAFGNNHEVVSRTPFIETVLGGKLTKAQFIDHLEQRVLVHQALDRVLSGSKEVPYGDPQKNVLTLLKADLAGVGGSANPSAKPLTKTLIEQIEASAKQGPWFALGVFHVYYGGITNGGRDIGAMMAEQVGYSPTYYLKSDGYMDYARTMNAKTLAPEAQKEAVRGGVTAYQYIIAINGEKG